MTILAECSCGVLIVRREERAQRAEAELAAHDQLVTQLTLLHHQVRSQHAVHRGYAPRNLLTDAYYTPVRCPCAWLPTSSLCCEPCVVLVQGFLRRLAPARA